MQRSIYFVSALILAFSTSLLAKKDQKSDTTDTGKFTVSGYIDSYYFKNLNDPLSGGNATNSGFERIFDQREGQFQLGLVQTKFGYSTSKSEVVMDLTFGPNADLGNYGNYNSLNVLKTANGSDITSTALIIKQAYWTYKATDKLSFTAGQFGTHIGYEVIDAPINYNYSLSNLFGNGPFYHLGAKANYAVSDKLALMAGVVNNWDNNFDNNKYKSVIAQVFVSPIKGFNIYVNWIGGNEDSPTGGFNKNIDKKVNAFKQMFDLTTGYQATEKLYVGFNGAIGYISKQENPENGEFDKTKSWGGAALYSNYKVSDLFGFGIRAEHFDNTQGVQYLKNLKYTGLLSQGTDVTSITLTPTFTLDGGHLLLKPELRIDSFKKFGVDGEEQLEDKDGNFTKSSQTTVGVAAIYKF